LKPDVVSIGEAIVDFLPDARGKRVRDVARWHPCLGGAPANVVVGLARLGATSALVGVTGDDEFGHFLKHALRRERVDISRLRQTDEGRTGLGFVSLTERGERSFTFYRERAAETFLAAEDIEGAARLIASAKVVHVGTNCLLGAPARAAVRAAMKRAQARGQLTSTDPNLRLHLWKDQKVLKRLVNELVQRCAIVKLSEEEIEFVTGARTADGALAWLEAQGVVLGVVTRGAKGAALRFAGQTRRVPAPKKTVVDTTGAGDGFMAGLLYGVTRLYSTRAQLQAGDLDALEGHARFGCVVGSHVVTKLGAVAGLPTLAQLRYGGA
jgi:fructokinase